VQQLLILKYLWPGFSGILLSLSFAFSAYKLFHANDFSFRISSESNAVDFSVCQCAEKGSSSLTLISLLLINTNASTNEILQQKTFYATHVCRTCRRQFPEYRPETVDKMNRGEVNN
jgi:hypothetical protein